MGVSRRNFIVSTSAVAAGATLAAQPAVADARSTPLLVAQAGAPAPHGFDPKDPALKYDLVIANGEVLDPSQKLRGKPADVVIFDLVDGPVEFVDMRNNKRSGTKKLVPSLTVKGGRPFGRPPLPLPFTF